MKLIILTAILAASWAGPNKPSQLKLNNFYQSVQGESKGLDGKIINGEITEPHSIPYQAYLDLRKGNKSSSCGGSLIAPNVVLTAGHCADKASAVTVVLGAQKPKEYESTQVRINSTNMIVHEDYNLAHIANDIALIILPYAVELNEYISIVKLPSKGSFDSYAEKIGKVSGWGWIKGNEHKVSDTLRFTENPILSNSECREFFPDVEDYQVCLSGNGGHSACKGDSGGPLTVDDVQIGVASYVESSDEDKSIICLANFGSVYTRTTTFLEWIEKHMPT